MKEAKKTSWTVLGLGTVVTGLGSWLLRGSLRSGVMGFGVAHIVLGALDMLRPTVRR